MFEFDIDDFLADMEGKHAKEKIEALDELYEEMDCVMQEILSAAEEIADEYEQEQSQKLSSVLPAYIVEKGLSDSVQLVDDTFMYIEITCPNRDNHKIRITPSSYKAELSIYISPEFCNDANFFLPEIAKAIGTQYQRGSDWIEVDVSEEELCEKMMELISKINNLIEKLK